MRWASDFHMFESDPRFSSMGTKQRRQAAFAAAALLIAAAALFSQTAPIRVVGRVTSASGAALVGAKLSLKDASGKTLASAFTDQQGRYSLPLLDGSSNQLDAECAGYQAAVQAQVQASGGAVVHVNFQLKQSTGGTPSSSLGAVSYYETPSFQAGRLTDPSAGGGYSDQASSVAGKMIGQYLTPQHPSAPSSSGAPPDEQALEREGSGLLKNRDYTRATSFYREASGRYPRSARLAAGLGIALYGQGQYLAAVGALCHAARLKPDEASTYVFLAEAMQWMPRSDAEAERLVQSFAGEHPRIAAGHYAYALALWRNFRLKRDAVSLAGAQSELESAVKLDPSLTMAHFRLGMVYDQEHSTGRAIQEYRAAERLDSSLAGVHYRLAQDDERVGAKREAAKEIQLYTSLRAGAQ